MHDKILLMSICIAAFTACGIDSRAHYDQDSKTFGKDTDAAPSLGNSNDGPVLVPDMPTQLPEPTPTPSNPPQTHPIPEEPPPTSGHDLLTHYGLVGYFNSDSLARIVRGPGSDGLLENNSLYDAALRKLFAYMTSDESAETLELITHEDGKGRQVVTQNALTNNGDRIAKIKGNESQSGTQKLYWVLPSENETRQCPKTFICVDKITWVPNLGKSATYCFKDMATKVPIAAPYAPNPLFSPEAFKASIPNTLLSKPFLMTKHNGIVDCADPDITTIDLRSYQWRVSIGDLRDARKPEFLRKAIFKPLAPDSEISVEVLPYDLALGRTYQPNHGPFIDEVSRFNMKIRYFLSSSNHSFVKIVRTIQSSFETPFRQWLDRVLSTYQDSILYIPVAMAIDALKWMIPRDDSTVGLQLDYVHEFCSHKANAERLFNHCTGTASP